MKTYPPLPRIGDAPEELLDAGHLWILEKVDGAHLRFQLRESGRIRFGGRDRVYNDPDAIPEPYQHAVRRVRERLDRTALRDAVDDVESIVFFGEAMHRHTIDYDWDRIPSFLGFDIWSATEGEFLGPDVVEQVFERTGLCAVNAFERELPARDFDPATYTVPQSAWYVGPAEGVVVRSKTGQRAQLLHPEFQESDETVQVDASPEELAESYSRVERFEKLVADLEGNDGAVDFDQLYERVLEDITREAHPTLYRGSQDVEMGPFRSAVAARTRAFLDERE